MQNPAFEFAQSCNWNIKKQYLNWIWGLVFVGLYRRIVSCVLLRSGLGSPTDIAVVREATGLSLCLDSFQHYRFHCPSLLRFGRPLFKGVNCGRCLRLPWKVVMWDSFSTNKHFNCAAKIWHKQQTLKLTEISQRNSLNWGQPPSNMGGKSRESLSPCHLLGWRSGCHFRLA